MRVILLVMSLWAFGLGGCRGPLVSPDTTVHVRTARLACDANPEITTDVSRGRLLDLAATVLRTKNGILSAEVVPESMMIVVRYRDDRTSEPQVIREVLAYFQTYRFNINVAPVAGERSGPWQEK